MSENLNKKPPKGILKQSSSFDTNSSSKSSFTPRCSITSLTSGGGSGALLEGVGGLEEEFGCSSGAGGGSGEHMDPVSPSSRKKSAKFDEMNILETLHPADKDYGHMKIEEPKTPFNYYEENEEIEGSSSASSQKKKPHEILLDPEELAQKIKEKGGTVPSFLENPRDEDSDDDEDDDDGNPENKEKKKFFESKRKAHYNEYFAVKLARQLMEKEGEGEDEDEDGPPPPTKFIPAEETLAADLN